MKKFILCLFLIGCAPSKETVSIIKGHDGKDGKDGVSATCSIVEEFFLSCSDGTYAYVRGPSGQNGVDGQDGQDGTNGQDGQDGQDGETGPQGPPGEDGEDFEVTIATYSSTSCTLIANTTKYVKVSNNNVVIYNSSSCSSSNKFAEVSQGESYWVSSTAIASYYTSGSIKVIYF